MIEKLSPEARTMLSDFLNQIDYEKNKEIERLKEENNNLKFTPKMRFKDIIELRDENKRLNNIINDLLSRIAILEREVEEHEGF